MCHKNTSPFFGFEVFVFGFDSYLECFHDRAIYSNDSSIVKGN